MPAFLDHQHLHVLLISAIRLVGVAAAARRGLSAAGAPVRAASAKNPLQEPCRRYRLLFYQRPGAQPAADPAAGAGGPRRSRGRAVRACRRRSRRWPIWARAVAALVVGEIGFYWGHRWTHEIPFLWRFHSVHHNPAQVYFLISARAHPIDNVFTRLCGLIPVYILGLATPLTPAGGVVSALLVLVHHDVGLPDPCQSALAAGSARMGDLDPRLPPLAPHAWASRGTATTRRCCPAWTGSSGPTTCPATDGRRPTASRRNCPVRWPDSWSIRCARGSRKAACREPVAARPR